MESRCEPMRFDFGDWAFSEMLSHAVELAKDGGLLFVYHFWIKRPKKEPEPVRLRSRLTISGTLVGKPATFGIQPEVIKQTELCSHTQHVVGHFPPIDVVSLCIK